MLKHGAILALALSGGARAQFDGDGKPCVPDPTASPPVRCRCKNYHPLLPDATVHSVATDYKLAVVGVYYGDLKPADRPTEQDMRAFTQNAVRPP